MIGTLKPLQPPLTTASGGRVYTGLGVPLRQWLQPLPGIAPVYSFPFSTEPSPYPPSALLTSYGVPLRTARGALLLIGRLPLPALVPILPDPQATRITWPLALRTRFGAELETMFGAPLLPGFRPFPPTRIFLTGVTKDSTGTALGSCLVALYLTATDKLIDRVTSDASGNYTFSTVGPAETYYVVAYKAGSPDVAGTTVNTLTGA